jgi:hypothetical protein
MLRIFGQIVGAASIVLVFFFATLFILDRWDRGSELDTVRAQHASQIRAALEAYRGRTGHYPAPFSDNPLTDVEKEIGGPLPRDPRGGANQYRYVSSADGKRYGLLFHLENGAACISGVGVAGTGWWLNAPQCK